MVEVMIMVIVIHNVGRLEGYGNGNYHAVCSLYGNGYGNWYRWNSGQWHYLKCNVMVMYLSQDVSN